MTDLDEEARAAVLMQLGLAHDHFIATERSERKQGHEAAAEGAHRVSVWLLRAYAAERDDLPVTTKGPSWQAGP